jgi:putative chitinase
MTLMYITVKKIVRNSLCCVMNLLPKKNLMNILWDKIEALFPRAQDGVFIALRDIGVPLMELRNEQRFCYCIAQLAHETGGFQWLRELGGEDYFTKLYENRGDLGNNQPGDGAKFPGRGLIHVTGRANYTACADYTKIDCVNHPELLENPVEACQSAAWYWQTKKYQNLSINDWCDRRDFVRVTKMINGGTRGLSNRRKYLMQISGIIGVRL